MIIRVPLTNYEMDNPLEGARPDDLLPSIVKRIQRRSHPNFPTHDTHVMDYLRFKAPYAFGAHTDTEWNSIANDGYQVWCLLSNENMDNKGNMFLIDNEYLFNKYSKRKNWRS